MENLMEPFITMIPARYYKLLAIAFIAGLIFSVIVMHFSKSKKQESNSKRIG